MRDNRDGHVPICATSKNAMRAASSHGRNWRNNLKLANMINIEHVLQHNPDEIAHKINSIMIVTTLVNSNTTIRDPAHDAADQYNAACSGATTNVLNGL